MQCQSNTTHDCLYLVSKSLRNVTTNLPIVRTSYSISSKMGFERTPLGRAASLSPFPSWRSPVIQHGQSSQLDEVPCDGLHTSVNKQEINAQISGRMLHVPRERNKVTPICTIILFFQVAFQPSMSISLEKSEPTSGSGSCKGIFG
jgi:hypothetical protein